jgi:hypothetical protein
LDREKGSIIHQVIIPDYMEYVVLSKKRKVKYYNIKSKIPKKYLNENKYKINASGIIIDISTEEKIISNPRSQGKPRLKKISGQDIWTGMDFFLRSKIARDVKNSFKPFLSKLSKVEKYPVGVALDFYKNIGKGNWDIDNHSLIYRKCVFDCLKDCGVIEDDSVKYITSTPTNYYEIDESDNRRLVITLFSN